LLLFLPLLFLLLLFLLLLLLLLLLLPLLLLGWGVARAALAARGGGARALPALRAQGPLFFASVVGASTSATAAAAAAAARAARSARAAPRRRVKGLAEAKLGELGAQALAVGAAHRCWGVC